MARRVVELDMRGRPCPVPIIEAAKAIARLDHGDELRVRGSDPGFARDLAAWCVTAGHRLKSVERLADETVGCVRKGPSPQGSGD